MKLLDDLLNIARDDFLNQTGSTEEAASLLETLSAAVESPYTFQVQAASLSHTFLSELLQDGTILGLLSDADAQTLFQILYLHCLMQNNFASMHAEHKDALAEDTRNILDLALIDRDRQEALTYIRTHLEKITAYFSMLKTLGVEPDADSFGRGFGDTWEGRFRPADYEILSGYVAFLKKHAELQELAEKIGHHADARTSVQKQKTYNPAVAYDGIHHAADLQALLPSELVLHQNEATRTEFFRRFTERKLECYKAAPDQAGSGKKEQKGPVIICLDTSGSMHGSPERIAKALVLALIRICVQESRALYLISFSVSYQSLCIKQPAATGEMERILSFLRMSFYGGTDIGPAFSAACDHLRDDAFKNADVLMVSDFLTLPLSEQAKTRIDSAKLYGTVFYALEVGASGNEDILALMDKRYRYTNGLKKVE